MTNKLEGWLNIPLDMRTEYGNYQGSIAHKEDNDFFTSSDGDCAFKLVTSEVTKSDEGNILHGFGTHGVTFRYNARKNQRCDLICNSIEGDELFVFEHNPKNNNGIFSIFDLNGKHIRQVVYTNILKEEFASQIDEIIKDYKKAA
jgi:hypothetical protein